MGSMHTILNIQCCSKLVHNCALKRCMIISKIIDFSWPLVAFKAHAECSVVESSLPMFIIFRKDKKHIHYLHVHTYFSSSNKVVLTLFFLISQHLMAGKSKLYYFIFKSILFLHEEHTLVCAGLYQHRNATENNLDTGQSF